MPVTKLHVGCPEFIETKVRGGNGYENRQCNKPIYMNGVCAACYRCNETLRDEGYSPMQATGGVAERMGRDAYDRLHIDNDVLIEKGIVRDVDMAMTNFDNELKELLNGS